VSDTTREGGSTPTGARQRRTPPSRLSTIVAAVLALVIVAAGTFVISRSVRDTDLVAATGQVQRLETINQKLVAQIVAGAEILNSMENKTKDIQAKLDAIMPSKDTYNIHPNQSLIIGGGHVTIALIGSPANANATININGKQYAMAAGDVVDIAPDPATACKVALQSFDMFKVLVRATCAPVKSP
jgi:hypothetical protein